MAAQRGAQFRAHSFVLFIFGQYARLIRWDRSCAVVSERFQYAASPDNYLAEFLSSYSLLDDTGRGCDPTMSRGPSEDRKVGDLPLPVAPGECPLEMERELHKSNGLNARGGPHKTELRRILIPDNPETLHPHIISYPLPFVALSPFGRATRPFLAYDPATDRIVFAKDYWRSTAQGMSKEGGIYRKLKSHQVKFIPPFAQGNDTSGHQTITNRLSNYEWAKNGDSETLQHYRMTLKVVGAPLKDFGSTRTLISAVADAMEGRWFQDVTSISLTLITPVAHDDAFFDAEILHRDISPGSILIAKNQTRYAGKNAARDEEVDNVKEGTG